MAVPNQASALRNETIAPPAFPAPNRQHEADVGPPAQRQLEAVQSYGAPAVSTWQHPHRPAEPFRARRYGGTGFSTTAYDANSVAVPNPRSWGRPSDNSPQVHEQPRDLSLHRLGQAQNRHSDEHYDTPSSANTQFHSAPPLSPDVPHQDFRSVTEQERRPPQHELTHHAQAFNHEQRPFPSAGFSRESAPLPSRGQSHQVSPEYHPQGPPPDHAQVPDPRDLPAHNPPPIATHPQVAVTGNDKRADSVPATASRPQQNYARAPDAGLGDSTGYEREPIRVQGEPMRPANICETRPVLHEQRPLATEFNPPRHSTPHHPLPAKPTQELPLKADGPGNDDGWAPKPSVELTDERAAWNSPNIQAWASNVNDTQQVPAAAVLSTDAADDVSLPERPDSARPVPKPVTIFISPDLSPAPGEAPSACQMLPSKGVLAERPDELSGRTSDSTNAGLRLNPTVVDDGDEFDRPLTPSDVTDSPNDSKEVGQYQLDPDFWKESTHPRDSPLFQSRRVIVV